MPTDDFLSLLNLDVLGKGEGKGKRIYETSDDDDFIMRVDSDSEADNKSLKSSSNRSSTSSRRSILSDDDDVMEEPNIDKPKKSKAKSSKSKGMVEKSTKTLAAVSQAGSSFLTAAERREQGKKDEKRSTEDPYSFLQDVKDVRFLSQILVSQ